LKLEQFSLALPGGTLGYTRALSGAADVNGVLVGAVCAKAFPALTKPVAAMAVAAPARSTARRESALEHAPSPRRAVPHASVMSSSPNAVLATISSAKPPRSLRTTAQTPLPV
jgi:hypothetical protein